MWARAQKVVDFKIRFFSVYDILSVCFHIVSDCVGSLH